MSVIALVLLCRYRGWKIFQTHLIAALQCAIFIVGPRPVEVKVLSSFYIRCHLGMGLEPNHRRVGSPFVASACWGRDSCPCQEAVHPHCPNDPASIDTGWCAVSWLLATTLCQVALCHLVGWSLFVCFVAVLAWALQALPHRVFAALWLEVA